MTNTTTPMTKDEIRRQIMQIAQRSPHVLARVMADQARKEGNQPKCVPYYSPPKTINPDAMTLLRVASERKDGAHLTESLAKFMGIKRQSLDTAAQRLVLCGLATIPDRANTQHVRIVIPTPQGLAKLQEDRP